MSVVIPFRDLRPQRAALRVCREGCEEVVASAFSDAFKKMFELKGFGQADLMDVIDIFIDTLHSEADKWSARQYGST